MFRPSYIEGRLRLAENRERQRGKGATLAAGAATDGAPTADERAAAEKAAEANMARLLQEEDAAKVSHQRMHALTGLSVSCRQMHSTACRISNLLVLCML